MQKENESMWAVGYARVSKDQEDSGYLLPAQEKLLREQAERNGYDLVKVFAIQESAAGKIQRRFSTRWWNMWPKPRSTPSSWKPPTA